MGAARVRVHADEAEEGCRCARGGGWRRGISARHSETAVDAYGASQFSSHALRSISCSPRRLPAAESPQPFMRDSWQPLTPGSGCTGEMRLASEGAVIQRKELGVGRHPSGRFRTTTAPSTVRLPDQGKRWPLKAGRESHNHLIHRHSQFSILLGPDGRRDDVRLKRGALELLFTPPAP